MSNTIIEAVVQRKPMLLKRALVADSCRDYTYKGEPLLVVGIKTYHGGIVKSLLESGFGQSDITLSLALKQVLAQGICEEVLYELLYWIHTQKREVLSSLEAKRIGRVYAKDYAIIALVTLLNKKGITIDNPNRMSFIIRFYKDIPLLNTLQKCTVSSLEKLSEAELFLKLYYAPHRITNFQKLLSLGFSFHTTQENLLTRKKQTYSPLLVRAASSGDYRTVTFLCNYGVILDGVDATGKTALYEALKNQNRRVAQYLIKRGARITSFSKEVYTPYASFFVKRNDAMLNYLRSIGIDCNFKSSKDRSVLSYLINRGFTSDHYRFQLNQPALVNLVSILEKEGYDFEHNSLIGSGRNALYGAIRANQLKLAQKLFEVGVSVDEGRGVYTPLFAISKVTLKSHISLALKMIQKSTLWQREGALSKEFFCTYLIELNGHNVSSFSSTLPSLSQVLLGGETIFTRYTEALRFFTQNGMSHLVKKLKKAMIQILQESFSLDDIIAVMATTDQVDIVLLAYEKCTPFELLAKTLDDSLKAYIFTKSLGGSK